MDDLLDEDDFHRNEKRLRLAEVPAMIYLFNVLFVYLFSLSCQSLLLLSFYCS